jgi:archaetidylinositol phosphate synthase
MGLPAVSHNTLLHRFVRPAVRRLAPTAIRPNHITLLRIATGLGAALAFAAGTTGWIAVGAGLFAVSALLDRADGELARLTRRFSRLGHVLDLVADFGADALAFIAMGYGARHGWLGHWALWLGASAAMGVAVLFWHLNRTVPGVRHQHPVRPVDPDDLVLTIPLLACCVGLAPVLLLAGTITPLAAAWLVAEPLRVRRRVTAPAE